MDQLAGLAPDSPLARCGASGRMSCGICRAATRRSLRRATTAVSPRAERAAAALRIADLLRDARCRNTTAPGSRRWIPGTWPSASPGGPPVHGCSLAGHSCACGTLDRSIPTAPGASNIDGLLAAGLSAPGPSSLSQLIAYVNFQSRVLAGLRCSEAP